MENLTSNKKAYHDYEIIETFEAGIVLCGTEIKSLRNNGAIINEAYIKIIAGEPWLIGALISHYKFGNINNHEEKRDRKLLLHKKEITKLKTAIQEKSLTLVPIGLYLTERGIAKIKIAKARGKKNADKRAAIKERDDKKYIQKIIKHFNT